VAGYVAKYATKAAENTGTLDRPVACWHCKGSGYDPDEAGLCRSCHGEGTRHDDVHHLVANQHAQAMISTCWNLGGRLELEELRLRPWAHMLGFRGHFSTKSRRYSTTLRCLRQARHDWRMRRIEQALGLGQEDEEQEETILVLGQWQYYGRGHSLGEAIYAKTIAQDLAESRRLGRLMRQEEFL